MLPRTLDRSSVGVAGITSKSRGTEMIRKWDDFWAVEAGPVGRDISSPNTSARPGGIGLGSHERRFSIARVPQPLFSVRKSNIE